MGGVGSPYDFDFTLEDGTKIGLSLVRVPGRQTEIPGTLSPADRTQTLNVPWTYKHVGKGLGYSTRDSHGDAAAEQAGERAGYGWGTSVCAWYDGWIGPSGRVTEVERFAANLGVPVQLLEFNGDVVLVFRQGVFSVTGGSATSATYRNGPTATTQAYGRGTVFGGNLYIPQIDALSVAGLLRYSTAYAATTDADVFAHQLVPVYWVVDGVASYRLIRMNGPSTLSYLLDGGDPMTLADWVVPAPSGIQIGNSLYAIGTLVTDGEVAWSVKPEGIFATDENLVSRNKTPGWVGQWDAISGQAACWYSYGGIRGIVAAHGLGLTFTRVEQGGLLTEMTFIDPSQTGSNNSPIMGRTYAVYQDGEWLIAATWNQPLDTTYIVRGKPSPDGHGFVWFGSEAELPGQKIVSMMTHTPAAGDFQPRRWYFGQTTAGVGVLSWQHLTRSASPLSELAYGTAFTWADAWQITFTGNDWGEPASKKVPTHLLVLGDGLGGGVSLAVSDSVDGGAFEVIDAVTSSPAEELTVDVTTGYVHTLRVDGTGTSTAPAIFRAMTLEANIAKKQSVVRSARIAIGPATPNGIGQKDGDVKWAQFLAAVERGEQMTMIDPTGQELLVQIDPNIVDGLLEQPIQANAHAPHQWIRTATFRYVVRESVARWDVALYDAASWVGGG